MFLKERVGRTQTGQTSVREGNAYRHINLREANLLCISNLYNILCTVNTQHTSRQDAIITIRLYLATCFGRNRPSSGQQRTILTL